MNKILQFLIFFVSFFSVYFLMHYYIYNRLSKVMVFKHLLIVFISLSITFPVSIIIEHIYYNFFTKILYALSAAWFGMIFFLLFGFLILDLVSLVWKINYHIGGVAVIVIVLAISLISIINAQNVQVTKIEVPLVEMTKENLKIVQITDVHLGSVHNKDFLQKIVDKTKKLNPDIVVITGDLFDGTDGLSKDLILPLKNLSIKAYFVTGNHENYLGKEKALKIISDAGITVLENKAVNIKGIQIIGLSNPESETDRSTKKLTEFSSELNISKTKPKIVLYHQPIFQEGADLQLSGHTHDGQIFPFNLLVRISYKYIYGLYNINGAYLYTSAGAGTWGPPMRFLANPEIVEITLKQK